MWEPGAFPGMARRFVDGEGRLFHVEKVQDVEPILERNKALRNAGDGFNADRSGRRIASIPMVVWLKWLAEGLDPRDHAAIRRKLRDPDWAYLRTSEGRL